MGNRILRTATQTLGRRWKDTLGELLGRLRFGVTVRPDAATGTMIPSFDVALREASLSDQQRNFAQALDAVEGLAAAKQAHVGLVLDEFQAIARHGGEDAEAMLRNIIQRQKHVSYVLAGSEHRIIEAMLQPRRPLFKLLEPLHFGPMDPDHLARWIEERMEGAGVRLKGAKGTSLGALIVRAAGPRTRDVVQLARATFEVAAPAGVATDDTVERAMLQIIAHEDDPLRREWDKLSPLQRNVLRALAVRATGLTTKAVREGFTLGTTGGATKAALTLVDTETLVKEGTAYRYDSPFFRAWVIKHTLPDVGLRYSVLHDPATA
jgi:hypothetical protein